MGARVSLIILALVISGCARNTSPQQAFREVGQRVCERSGYPICWQRFSESAEEVQALLAKELTEENAVRVALLNNPELQAIFEELGIAKADLIQAGLLENPIFSLTYQFRTQADTSAIIDIGIFQNFLEALLIPLKRRVAACELERTKAMVAAEVLEVIAKTRIAFIELQGAQQLWPLTEDALLGADAAYDAACRLRAAGNMTELELVAYRSFFEGMKVELANLEIKILERREELNQLMGLWGRQINWRAKERLAKITDEDDWGGAERRAVANSLDLAVERKELSLIATQYGVDATRIVLPQIDLAPTAQREGGDWFVGPAVGIPLPIFDFGHAASARARASILRQWNVYTALAIKIRSMVRVNRLQLLNARRQSRYYDQVLVPIAENLTHQTLLQVNAMQLGIFHLLDAKQEELQRKMTLVRQQRDYWRALARLETLIQGHLMEDEG